MDGVNPLVKPSNSRKTSRMSGLEDETLPDPKDLSTIPPEFYKREEELSKVFPIFGEQN